jgi:hypothetical protein
MAEGVRTGKLMMATKKVGLAAKGKERAKGLPTVCPASDAVMPVITVHRDGDTH